MPPLNSQNNRSNVSETEMFQTLFPDGKITYKGAENKIGIKNLVGTCT